MPINVSEAIDCDTAERITIIRYTDDKIHDGLLIKGARTRIPALASVQQPESRDLRHLEDGERSLDVRLFICNKRLRGSDEKDGTPADFIEYDGKEFKVIKPKAWEAYGHSTCMAIRVIRDK